MDILIKISAAIVLCAASLPLSAQKERALVREGNKLYIQGTQTHPDSIQNAIRKWDEAAEKYKEALKIDSTLVEGIFNLGDVAFNKGDYDEAIERFTDAIANTDDDAIKAKAHYNIGNCHLKKFAYKEGIEAYKSALRLVPGDMDAKYNLAYAQAKLKQEEPPKPEEQKKSQDAPQPSQYAIDLRKKAEDLGKQGQYSEAYDLMEQGTEIDTTVKYFKEFMDRLKDVKEVAEETGITAPPDTAKLKP
jgi:tetratricopeptide (TPR) repeat protein